MGKQSSQYDKIFKENIEAVIPNLIHTILGITAVSSEELPDDIQHTKERKPDVLKKIIDDTGREFVLHVEFQVADELTMVYRMAEYYIMLERKYHLPVEQYVFYLGATRPLMRTQLSSTWMTFEFRLIAFADLDYRIFLRSKNPEEVVLSVLGNFEGDSSALALERIVHRIEETTIGDFPLRKYFNQLRVLAQLRNLGNQLTDLAMDNISKFFSVEKDAVYMVGFNQGEINAKVAFVKNLLSKVSLTIEQIADIAGVTVDFVDNVRQEIKSGE